VAPIVAPDGAGIAQAAAALASGAVVGIPTDTVYGLAALPTLAGATDEVFEIKQRPLDIVLPVLVADDEQARQLGQSLSPVVERLMARYWPGPLTIVVERAPAAADFLLGTGSGADTIGVRCPDHAAVRELCRLAGPLATTSANRHGQPPLTNAADVSATFDRQIALVLDGGPCEGLPSTVIDCTGGEPRLLREGRLAWAELLQSIGGGRP
jgi:L-threonylcarbamoyladenylate synthase